MGVETKSGRMVSSGRIRRGAGPYMDRTRRQHGGALPADASRKLKDKILNFNENIRDCEETVSLLSRNLMQNKVEFNKHYILGLY